MPHADTLAVTHHDDTVTRYTDARYQLHRGSIRVWTADGETVHRDVLTTEASRRHAAAGTEADR
jgi:hypothetical protein